MPIKKSAIKRAKQNIVRRTRNRVLKTNFRSAVKEVAYDIGAGKKGELSKNVSKAFAAIDKAAKENAIHKNTAARKKSRLMKKVSASEKNIKLVSAKEK